MDAFRSAGLVMVLATVSGLAVARWPGLLGPSLSGFAHMVGPSGSAPAMAGASAGGPAGVAPAAWTGPTSSGVTAVLQPDRFGQFHTDLDVEGHRFPGMVDTGASWVTLPYEVARDLGYNPAPADFSIAMMTANGTTRVAPIEIGELRVGPIVVRHVRAVVNPPGTLTTGALLGMSFLRGLSGFSIDEGRLVLKQ